MIAKIKRLLPSAGIVLAGMYIVFYLIDRVNPAMAFINNEITKYLLLALCIVTIAQACMTISETRRLERKRMQARKGAARARKK